MKSLNNKDLSFVSAGSVSIYATFDVKLKETPIEMLPLIVLLAHDCVKYKWDVTQYTNKMINSGIDPDLILIDTKIEFQTSFHDYF